MSRFQTVWACREWTPRAAATVREAVAKVGGVNAVARIVPCDHSHVSRLSNGHRAPSAAMAARLADVLGLGPDERRLVTGAAVVVGKKARREAARRGRDLRHAMRVVTAETC